MLAIEPVEKKLTPVIHRYANNCGCSERGNPGHPIQDAAMAALLGFDGIKIDGCGPAHNITTWGAALNATGRQILLENCMDNNDRWSAPTPDQVEECNMNLYRVSGDIAPQFYSTMWNLQHMAPFLDRSRPLSRPGCWAYPDMLQVFNNLSEEESRTHFGAWCITSSPLVLGGSPASAAPIQP